MTIRFILSRQGNGHYYPNIHFGHNNKDRNLFFFYLILYKWKASLLQQVSTVQFFWTCTFELIIGAIFLVS